MKLALEKNYKRARYFFNGLGLALLAVGVIDFIFFGQNITRSQLYLAAAIASGFVAAIFYRVQRNRTDVTEVGEGGGGICASAWEFGAAGAFIVFLALFLFTDLITRPAVLYLCEFAFILLFGEIFFDRYRVRHKAGSRLILIHRIGIVFVVGVLALLAYLLIVQLFNWNPFRL